MKRQCVGQFVGLPSVPRVSGATCRRWSLLLLPFAASRISQVFWSERERLVGAVGIELRATLRARKLLILINEETVKNCEFAQVRYTPGTRRLPYPSGRPGFWERGAGAPVSFCPPSRVCS